MSKNNRNQQIQVRIFLNAITHDAFIEFCQDHFPEIFTNFSPGMTFAAQKNYLIDHYLRSPDVRERMTRHLSSASLAPQAVAAPHSVEPHAILAIVTPTSAELQAVLELNGGRDQWQALVRDRYMHHRSVWSLGRHSWQVLACSQGSPGSDETVAAVMRLAQLRPQLIAMIGVCAGREDAVQLGDLIVADRAYRPEEGKQTPDGHQPDIQTFQPPGWLMQRLRDFAMDQHWHHAISTPRPLSPRYQAEWLLCQIKRARRPYPATEDDWRAVRAAGINVTAARAFLHRRGWLSDEGLPTRVGDGLLEDLRWRHSGELRPLADRTAPQVHYGAFGSMVPEVAVDAPFTPLTAHVRRALAIEHEVRSLFATAANLGIPAFAVKGVAGYGTPEQDDTFYAYAAEAAARWLYAFLAGFEL